jgi:LmbE family N-acetylglucosaminyl deacetylase
VTEVLTGPVLVVGAHPDDTEFAAGGTVATFTALGQQVEYIVCTDGSKGTKERSLAQEALVAAREEEQRAAATVLGVQQVTFLHQVDGELENTYECRKAVARVIRRLRPRVLIAHDPWRQYMLHPDHRAAGFISTDAFVAARDHLYVPELFRDEHLEPYDVPEIWLFAPAEVDFFVDITNTVEKKIEAIRCHTSQIRDPEGMATRLRTRTADAGARHGVGAAEEFKRLVI